MSNELQIFFIEVLFFAGSAWAFPVLASGAFFFFILINNETFTDLKVRQ
jgi:hypothetical protein